MRASITLCLFLAASAIAFSQPLIQGFFTTNGSAYLQTWVSNAAVQAAINSKGFQPSSPNLTNFSAPQMTPLSTNNGFNLNNIQASSNFPSLAAGVTAVWTNRTAYVTNTISVNGGVVTNVSKVPN